jgi:polysaccharide biosynthesis/export protein
VPVAPDGTISYLQAIAVHANGLTPDQLRTRIEADLAKYQKNVKVSINPTKILSKDFAIIGRVKKPGRYTLDRPTSVLEGIAMAEGIQVGTVGNSAYELADFDKSFVAGHGKKLNIDLAKLYFEGDFSQNAYLEPDDCIYVASNFENEVHVLGAVNNPGRRKMPVKLTITRAIGEAGGFVNGAFRMRVLHIKGSIHDPIASVVDMKAILEGRAKDFVVEDGDIVYVNYHPFHLVDQALKNAMTTFVQSAAAQTLNQNYTPVLN